MLYTIKIEWNDPGRFVSMYTYKTCVTLPLAYLSELYNLLKPMFIVHLYTCIRNKIKHTELETTYTHPNFQRPRMHLVISRRNISRLLRNSPVIQIKVLYVILCVFQKNTHTYF